MWYYGQLEHIVTNHPAYSWVKDEVESRYDGL